MLKTLRTLNETQSSRKPLIKEQDSRFQNNTQSSENSIDPNGPEDQSQQNLKNDINVINNVEVKLNSPDQADMTLDDNQKTAISHIIDSFRQQVSQIVSFKPGITMTPNQIRLDGSLTDNDINFVLIAGQEGGLYINAEMLNIEQPTMDVLTKLFRFQASFKDAMEPLITQRTTN